MVPGESPCYITFHTFLKYLTLGNLTLAFHTFHTFLTFHTFHTFHTFLTFLTLGFDLGISSQTGFFLGGVFGTFFWVGFLAQHGPEPPSPILLLLLVSFFLLQKKSFFLLQKKSYFPRKKTMTEASASVCLILATALHTLFIGIIWSTQLK